MGERISDVIFTDAMRAEQERLGSRPMIAKMEERGRWSNAVSEDLAGFLATRDSVYAATASADGRPYLQHRGGEPGFVRVLDARRIGWAELRGNRQYMTFGNLSENDRIALFFMDYPNRQRIKVWGRAQVVERDAFDAPMTAAFGEAERAVVVTIEAWDTNCPQHITPRYTETEVRAATETLTARIAALEAEVARLKAGG